MKLKYIIMLLAVAFAGLVLWRFVTYVPYYVNDDGLSMAIYDTETRISALIALSFLFTAGIYIFSIVITLANSKLMNSYLVRYATAFSPAYAIVGLIINLSWNLFVKMNDYDYANLGIDFMNANTSSFSSTITHAEVIELGKSLNIGVGFYLVWVIVILFLLQSVWYYRNFNKIFDVDVTDY